MQYKNIQRHGADAALSKDEAVPTPTMEAFLEEQGQKRLEQLLVAELNQMSLHEREKVYEEIHGVNQVKEETPAFLEERLFLLDQALAQIRHKPAYMLALSKNPSYCTNRKFRLSFLRAEYFDPRRAAVRLVKFFEGKLEYFGEDALARDIRLLDDMDKDDQQCLKAGQLQFLSCRDRAGRAVFCDFQAAFPRCYKNPRNMVKSFVYMMQCAANDEENQKLGIVGLLYHVGDQLNKPDPDLMAQGPATLHWVPIRFNGLHICVSHTMSSILARLLLMGAGREIRCRSRVHYGTHTECQYSLMTFGLPIHTFPIGGEGELKTAEFQKWVKKQLIKDEVLRKSFNFDAIDLPSSRDVLMGKGKPFQLHPGNVRLRYLCEKNLDAYNASRKGDKSEVATKVVEQCGRFLKRDAHGWWTEVSEEIAKDKAIKAFLSIRANEQSETPRITPSPPPVSVSASALSVTERDSKRARMLGCVF